MENQFCLRSKLIEVNIIKNMQRSFSFQFNVFTFQNLCLDENGLNEMVAKKNKPIRLRWQINQERERGRGVGGGGGGGVVGILVQANN